MCFRGIQWKLFHPKGSEWIKVKMHIHELILAKNQVFYSGFLRSLMLWMLCSHWQSCPPQLILSTRVYTVTDIWHKI